MAEGLVGGILGEGEEKPEFEAPEPLAGAEAFAAMASRQDPEVARKTGIFLDKQSQLLETQNKHLQDEHALRIAHLRNQLREELVRRFGLRLRVGFQLFLVLVATVLGIGGVVLLHDAVTCKSVVMEPFETPRELADRGLTGTVVASGILDQLTQLQAATRTSMDRRNLSNAWSKEIKLTVPETGLSIGEISQLLKARFSDDIHISGHLVQTKAGGSKSQFAVTGSCRIRLPEEVISWTNSRARPLNTSMLDHNRRFGCLSGRRGTLSGGH